MNTKQIVTRTTTIFAGLSMAGIMVAMFAQVVPGEFAHTVMVAVGCAILSSALTFFLISMSNLEK